MMIPTTETEDVALKLLHTADWHLGRRFPSFDEKHRLTLSRARLDVLDRILQAAHLHAVDAVLCAGDLFDEPNPDREWWSPVAQKLANAPRRVPIFLLPGNHDPLLPGSVYSPDHPFRRALPSWAHVVDRDDYSFLLGDWAVLHARPCRSQAGHDDLALALPAREPGDERIRIGMVHGSTFDAVETHFPIAKDAAARRGFDYLAIGDTHSFRQVPPDGVPPVVYPGTPEPTTFDEPKAGHVVAVLINRARRVVLHPERVAYWTWSDRTVRSLPELRDLHVAPELVRTVLRLTVDMRLSAAELDEAEQILRDLEGSDAVPGRAGILQLDRGGMILDTTDIAAYLAGLPEVLRAAAERLREQESGERAEVARAALLHLYHLARRAGAA
jgi:DNA repair exonuclease SbcCD nuclease subunit